MGIDVLGATTSAIDTGKAAVSGLADSGLASGVSGVTDAVSGALGAVGSLLGGGSAAIKLPLPNVLSNYASYDYILSLSAMTVKDINFPDSTYKAGKKLPLICKSAGADPSNRVQTAYGKYDFFMDNLKFESIIGPHNAKSTNVTTVQFDVLEPYSLGVFILALQTAAYNSGHKNWRDAPFLLTIEFRGNTQTGQMVNIPAVRHIPIKLTTVNFKANEQGSQYMINAFAVQNQALTVQHANLKTDVTIKGKTIQEVLQTGQQSLQAVVNKQLQDMVKSGAVKVADQVLITFPKDISSVAATDVNTQSNTSSTINPKTESASGGSSIFTKLGVVQSSVNQTYIQQDGQVNELGTASMGYDLSKRGDTSTKDEQAIYNEKSGTWTRGKVVSNPTEGSLRFAQDVDIPTVINQVLLLSDYPTTALDSNNEDAEGFRTWWRVDTQVYYIETDDNLAKTGTMPRVVVYRVVPFKAHSSKLTPPNQPAVGFPKIEKKIVKRYDYLYTGKNSEILKFDIDFSVNFSNVMAADGGKNNQDVVAAKSTGNVEEKQKIIDPLADGLKPEAKAGSNPTMVKNTGTGTSLDKKGGGGTETEITRAAKVWHDAITNPNDMININMDIYGDPFWICNSGQGNYTSKAHPASKDLCVDGSVNWQTSEVDVLIKFRSPFDINQTTGLYNFGSNSQMAPVMGFNGLYCVTTVTNYFRGGVFRQTLKGFRRPLQESSATPVKGGGIGSDLLSSLSTVAGIGTSVANLIKTIGK